jgi:urease accessory protein
METDTIRVREGRPFVFTDLLRREGLDDVIAYIEKHGGLVAARAAE